MLNIIIVFRLVVHGRIKSIDELKSRDAAEERGEKKTSHQFVSIVAATDQRHHRFEKMSRTFVISVDFRDANFQNGDVHQIAEHFLNGDRTILRDRSDGQWIPIFNQNLT